MMLSPAEAMFLFGITMLLTALLVLPVRRFAVRVGAVDQPGGRRMHDAPTPRLGGIAIVLSLLAVLGIALGAIATMSGFLAPEIERALVLVVGTGLLTLTGALDDVRGGIRAGHKLLVEAIVITATVLLVLGVPRVDFGFGAMPEWAWPVSLVFTVFWVLAITNAYNMIDGLDGLAGGVGAISALALAVIAHWNGAFFTMMALIALAGALAGFLMHNRKPARIFMGDAGTLPVGFLLGMLSVMAARGDAPGWSFLPIGIALGVPLADIALAVSRRALRSIGIERRNGEIRERFQLRVEERPKLFHPDAAHLHHRLLNMGLGYRRTVGTLYLFAFLLGGTALAAAAFPPVAPWIALALTMSVAALGARYLYADLDIFGRGLLLPLFDLRLMRSRWFHRMFDGVSAMVAWCLTTFLLVDPGAFGDPLSTLRTGLLASGLLFFLLFVLRVYQGSFRHISIAETARLGSLVLGSAFLTGAILQVSIGDSPWPAAFATLFAFFAMAPILGARVSYRILDDWHQRRAGTGQPALIYGTGRRGTMALAEILQNPELGIMPVGFLDDEPGPRIRRVEGYRVLGGADELDEILDRTDARVVVVAARHLCEERHRRVQATCSRRGVRMKRWGAALHEVEST